MRLQLHIDTLRAGKKPTIRLKEVARLQHECGSTQLEPLMLASVQAMFGSQNDEKGKCVLMTRRTATVTTHHNFAYSATISSSTHNPSCQLLLTFNPRLGLGLSSGKAATAPGLRSHASDSSVPQPPDAELVRLIRLAGRFELSAGLARLVITSRHCNTKEGVAAAS